MPFPVLSNDGWKKLSSSCVIHWAGGGVMVIPSSTGQILAQERKPRLCHGSEISSVTARLRALTWGGGGGYAGSAGEAVLQPI